jgi:hypothetical protein
LGNALRHDYGRGDLGTIHKTVTETCQYCGPIACGA